MIFAPEGNMFLVLEREKKAQKATYKFDPTTKPQNLDISFQGETAQTILEFTSDGQLRLQIDGADPKKKRPTDFNDKVMLLKKVSDVTTLPSDVKLTDSAEKPGVTSPLEPSDRDSTSVKQGRARNFIRTLNRASQAYFVENERFSGDIDQLLKGFGSKPNSPNYDFSLALIDEKKAVQTIVVAKLEGLKSYTGLTYAIAPQPQGNVTKSIVCESDRPTQEKPSAPEVVNNEANCPTGYTPLNLRRY
jgi:Type IV pilin-like G and H, putative